jgi:hypothetical protein
MILNTAILFWWTTPVLRFNWLGETAARALNVSIGTQSLRSALTAKGAS